jgi:glyoxylase-like metal-dependent hydrolase (beta-lactamase superfamily II)
MREILPGLHHWTTLHPKIGQDVSSYYVVESRALLDPMVPDDGLEAFDGLPRPEHVVLSCRHHDRSHADFVEAFGCEFHVSEHGVHEYEGEAVQPFAIGDEPVPGIAAVANGPIAPDDTVLRVDVDGGALAFADSLVNYGGVGFVPDYLLGDDPEAIRRDITARARELLAQRFDHLLFAHGEPIVGGGRQALEEFVAEQG